MPNPYIEHVEFDSQARLYYHVNSLVNELINCALIFGTEKASEMLDCAIENGIEYYNQKVQRIEVEQ